MPHLVVLFFIFKFVMEEMKSLINTHALLDGSLLSLKLLW
jgi:hypothetical protein